MSLLGWAIFGLIAQLLDHVTQLQQATTAAAAAAAAAAATTTTTTTTTQFYS